MKTISFFDGRTIPLERHKVRIVQKLNLLPVEQRLARIREASSNLYLLRNRDVFLDMLTDSGVNAMSDIQQAAMMKADDAYAGSDSFFRLEKTVRNIFGMEHFLPVHQGRGCEKIISDLLVKPGDIIPMNYHFTTTKAHIERCGGEVVELITPEGICCQSDHPFKGNLDTEALATLLEEKKGRVPFVRVEAGTNLIGGQPHSFGNLKKTSAICRKHGIPLVLDASLLQDNLYFLKTRDEECTHLSLREIMRAVADECDIIYFSARKLGFARGGGICMRESELVNPLKELVVLNEGFLTYGGMSVREIEAMAVGLEETLDFSVISQGPEFISYMVGELEKRGVPVVTPAGGLGCHLDASRFVPHIPGEQYPAACLAAALYIAGGIRGMERGTLSESRDADGNETIADMELLRLAMPRRVFTLSQIDYAIDRVTWLYENRDVIGGLCFEYEPNTLRDFLGKLAPLSDWQEKLAEKFSRDLPGSL